MPPTPLGAPNVPDAPIPLLASEYLESLPAFIYTPDTPTPLIPTDTPKTAPTSPRNP